MRKQTVSNDQTLYKRAAGEGGGGVGRIDVNPTCKTRLCDVVIFWLKRKKYSLVLKNAELHVVHEESFKRFELNSTLINHNIFDIL